MQYNSSGLIDKYKFVKTIEIPESIKNLREFLVFYNDYETLLKKIKNARKNTSRNKYIKALKSIITEEYNYDLIKDTIKFKHWECK